MKSKKAKGRCFCKGIQFECTNPSKFSCHCHCSMCRRASAAPFVSWGVYSIEGFKITKGKNLLTKYRSSAKADRFFCKKCGTQLFFKSRKRPKTIDITLCSLYAGLDKTPTAHVFVSDRLPWIALDRKLERYGGKTGFKKLRT